MWVKGGLINPIIYFLNLYKLIVLSIIPYFITLPTFFLFVFGLGDIDLDIPLDFDLLPEVLPFTLSTN